MPPSTTFADLGVPADIVAALHRKGIDEPFPIQSMTVPDALAGRDVCGKAPTGSGKTLAFGIGAVARLSGPPARPRHPRVLVLTPTRELAAQVASELQVLATPRGLRVDSFYGGVGYGPQLKALGRGVDVAVACPGRLGDLLERGSIRLDAVEIVVVDEADRMADMGFLPDVKRILDLTPAERQTVLFSATLDGDIDVLVKRYQNDPARHELEVDEDEPSAAVHMFWRVASGDRVELTASVAAVSGPTIVFCRTKHSTDRIARQLEQRGLRTAAIHGDRSQKQRERALEQFMEGSVDVLVATDVAARGIHVDGVNAVVHYDPSADPKDYVHRSGRTARAGAIGVVVSFVTPDKAGAVKRLQRELDVPSGTIQPDVAAITAVLGDPPPRRKPPERREKSANASSARLERPRNDRRPRDERPSRFDDRRPRANDGERRAPGSGEAQGGEHRTGRPERPGKPFRPAKPFRSTKPHGSKPHGSKTHGAPGAPSAGGSSSSGGASSGGSRPSRPGRPKSAPGRSKSPGAGGGPRRGGGAGSRPKGNRGN